MLKYVPYFLSRVHRIGLTKWLKPAAPASNRSRGRARCRSGGTISTVAIGTGMDGPSRTLGCGSTQIIGILDGVDGVEG